MRASGRQCVQQRAARDDDLRRSIPGLHERAEGPVCQHEAAAPASLHVRIGLGGTR